MNNTNKSSSLPEDIQKEIHRTVQVIHTEVLSLKDLISSKEDRLLDVGDVCNLLHLSPRQIHRIKKEGKLKGFQVGRRRLYRASEVSAYIRILEEKANR